MCGIAGFCDFSKNNELNNLNDMLRVIAHRGPDDEGLFIHHGPTAHVGLGHKRLSILDLSPLGHQPYKFNGLALVYNGEVYNYAEIRQKLIHAGYSFSSNSDTEVIIKAYDAWGIHCVDHFIGMFAFVLFDLKKQKLYLVRDRAGVKPLYYYWHNQVLLFGSELKSFHENPLFSKEMDYDSLALYLQYSYIPAPYSIFKNTFKLRPGHILEIDLTTREFNDHPYWNVIDSYNKPKLKISYEDAKTELEKILKSSFDYRMVSDVPVGVFLSGGYDSSAVAALLQSERTTKLKTFTIGFEEQKYNEAPFAKRISDHLGTDHTEHYCTHKEAFDIIPKLPDIYDEPFGDNSIIPTTLVSQLAIQHVKVALSGDGGDEIFAGYPKFGMSLNYTSQFPHWMQSLLSAGMGFINPDKIPGADNAFNFGTRYRKMQQIWGNQKPEFAMKVISQFHSDYELSKLLKHPFQSRFTYFDIAPEINDQNDALNRMLAIDFKTFLVDNNLTKIDRATMSVSLEGREPLLDHRIVEFAAQLPSRFKYTNGNTKIILKDIVHDYIPRAIMERPKMGFIVPIMGWFRNELKGIILEFLDETKLKQDDIFNPRQVLELRDKYLDGKSVNVQKLWHILLFQMWKKRWYQ
jgi:asparagine synthase (glutamine-hydrolysing)